MFREMRRKDRELSQAEAIEILENGDYGVLSTIGENWSDILKVQSQKP